jgi:predicted AAA+ superfamily ATPase
VPNVLHIEGHVARDAEPLVHQLLEEEPAILVGGPRGSGKSTLLRALTEERGGRVLDLDDPATARLVAEDPAGAVVGDQLVFVDEYQRVPEILSAVKREVDRNPGAGRFLLAGSVSERLLPSGTETLTGRVHRLHLPPLAAGEVLGGPDRLVASLLRDGQVRPVRSDLTRADYFGMVAAGGYPAALGRPTDRARQRWYASYLSTVADRDLPDLVDVRHPGALSRLYRLVAEETSSIVARSGLGERLALSPATARAYLDLLERVHVIAELPGWTVGVSAKVARRPKLYVTDTGLGATAIQLDGRRLAASAIGGGFLESFVVNEIVKQAAAIDEPLTLAHYRDRSGIEVDIIVERADGSVIAIEVKSATSVRSGGDTAGLRLLRDRLGTSLIAGIVLHTGPVSAQLDERLWALPVAALWGGTA